MKSKRLKIKKTTLPNLLKSLQSEETLIYTAKQPSEHIKKFEKIYKAMVKRLKISKKDEKDENNID